MKVISNTACSLDGRINTIEGRFTSLGSEFDTRQMEQLRDLADAVLVGGQTFRNWPFPSVPRSARTGAPFYNVIVSRTLQVPLDAKLWTAAGVRLLVLTRRQPVPSNFPPEVELEFFDGPGDPQPEWMLACLARRGIQTLLIEAGGELLFQFVAAQLIDELYVTLCPLLIGGHKTPSLLSGQGFTLHDMPRLSLLSSNVIGDEIYLHYRVNRAEKTARS